jgi:hypothetical protein
LQNAVGINDSMLILVNGVDSRTPNVTHAYLYQGPLFPSLRFRRAAARRRWVNR